MKWVKVPAKHKTLVSANQFDFQPTRVELVYYSAEERLVYRRFLYDILDVMLLSYLRPLC